MSTFYLEHSNQLADSSPHPCRQLRETVQMLGHEPAVAWEGYRVWERQDPKAGRAQDRLIAEVIFLPDLGRVGMVRDGAIEWVQGVRHENPESAISQALERTLHPV